MDEALKFPRSWLFDILKGKAWMSDDFNEPLEEMAECMEINLIGGLCMVTEINLTSVGDEAKSHYLSGDFFCSEAIVAVIRKHFQADMPPEAIAMASGFPLGVAGAQCLCGVVSGGVLCIGFFFGRTAPQDPKVRKAMKLSSELLTFFKSKHKVTSECYEIGITRQQMKA